MDPSEGEYSVADALPHTAVERLNAGTNLLLLGPETDTMRSVAEDIIAMAPEHTEGAVWISLEGDIAWLIDDFADDPNALASLSIIEGSGKSEEIEGLDPNQRFAVDSPKQLTDLGMALIEYEDTRGGSFDGSRIVFDSITTLLANAGENRVFEFIAAFSGRIRVEKNLGIWLMNSGEHSQETVTVFRELFDIVVELPTDDDSDEIIVEEEAGDTGDWVSKEATRVE